MRRTWTLSMLAGAAIGVSGAAAVAESDAWSSSNTDEVRALVAEMLSDAENRTSLLQGGGSAGHDGKFFIASADGNFRMNVGGQVQFRWTGNFRDDGGNTSFDLGDGAGGGPDGIADFDQNGESYDDNDYGFEMRRTKLHFTGTLFDEWDFKVQGAFDRDGGSFELEDAYFSTAIGDSGWTWTAGQFKAPLLREELVSSSRLQAADRSLSNELFTANRTTGVMFSTEQENWRAHVSMNDGAENSYINDYNSFAIGANADGGANTAFDGDDTDFAVTARFEYMWAGEWDNFKDITSAPGQANAGMFGGAVHYQVGADNGSAPNDDSADILIWTGDVSWESDGWNVFGAIKGASLEGNQTLPVPEDQDPLAFTVQGGIYINDNTEVFAGYDYIDYDDTPFGGVAGGSTGSDDQSIITIGLNHYMHGHAAKLTVDFNWALEESFVTSVDGTGTATDAFGVSGIGYLGDDDEDEIWIRAQFQLLF